VARVLVGWSDSVLSHDKTGVAVFSLKIVLILSPVLTVLDAVN
jgi:hypothetical protein